MTEQDAEVEGASEESLPTGPLDEGSIAPARGWAYAVGAGVPFVFGVLMLIGSLGLGLGSLSSPGPGLWPFVLSAALVLLSLVLFVGWSRYGPCESWGTGVLRIGIGGISIAGYVMLLPRVGFEIPSFVLLAFWMKALGGERWRPTLLVSAGTVVGLHLVFVELLHVPTPYLFGF